MAPTLLDGSRETELATAARDGEQLFIPLDALPGATGWSARPEGLCRGDVCVPIPAARRADWLRGGALDFAAFARHLGHAVVHDAEHDVWALGPAAGAGLAAGTGPVVAPDLRLPDLDGRVGTLSEHRGKKVLLYCWASW